jgi:hypothetical protein
MKVQINRLKNFLYTHEQRDQLLSVTLKTRPEFWRGRIPLVSAENLLGVIIGLYRPTKKVYTDPKQFPGKEMPQREYRLVHRYWKDAKE